MSKTQDEAVERVAEDAVEVLAKAIAGPMMWPILETVTSGDGEDYDEKDYYRAAAERVLDAMPDVAALWYYCRALEDMLRAADGAIQSPEPTSIEDVIAQTRAEYGVDRIAARPIDTLEGLLGDAWGIAQVRRGEDGTWIVAVVAVTRDPESSRQYVRDGAFGSGPTITAAVRAAIQAAEKDKGDG